MPTPPQPPRRRFLFLRVLFFLLSLPFLYWALTQYGTQMWRFAQSYSTLQGFWYWLATILIVWASWSLWRRIRRKAAKARQLVAELERR
ncbi:MAG: hypothetical protein ACKVP7_13840 [Hyphomicrobiaceae bacterium]